MTRTNKLSIAITSMFLTIAASSAAAGPLGATGSVTGAAGIDLGGQAQIAPPIQIQKKELGLPASPNAATPATPSNATGSSAVPALPGNSTAQEQVLEHRNTDAARLNSSTDVRGNIGTESDLSVNSRSSAETAGTGASIDLDGSAKSRSEASTSRDKNMALPAQDMDSQARSESELDLATSPNTSSKARNKSELSGTQKSAKNKMTERKNKSRTRVN